MTLGGTINPLYSLSGFVVGALVGLTGVGGGALMTPLLVLLFGIHPAVAVGTDLLYAACTKSVGTLVHGLRHSVEWRVTGLLAAGSLPAAAATLAVLVHLGPPGPAVSGLISQVLGVTLLLTATSLLFQDRILGWAAARRALPSGHAANQPGHPPGLPTHAPGLPAPPAALPVHAANRPRYARAVPSRTAGLPGRTAGLTVATGLALGVLVSISSVGAGALGVSALILLYPGLPTARIVGSDVAHAVPLTLLAGLGHWMIGAVDWTLFGALIVGSVPGIVLGSIMASRVPERVLRPAMAAVLILAGARLVLT